MAALIPRPNYPPYGGGQDAGREEVDKLLTETEKKVHKIYLQAAQEMKRKADDYLKEFQQIDREKAIQVAAGTLSPEEYKQWRYSHILQGRRWYEMADVLATDMTNSNQIAANIISKSLPDVFATGYNYALYQGEMDGGFRTSFTLYNRDAVERLVAEDPDLLPQPSIKVPEDLKWNKKQINSAMTQAIVQGDTLKQCAARLAASVAGMNERTAIRNARTACTSAENGGRYNGFRRLKKAGVDLVAEWSATLDSRTRHTHRLLDGQRREIDEPFEVDGQKILYAGDMNAPQGLIWNCRCKIYGWIKGFEESRELRAAEFPNDEYESYAEWKFEKQQEEEERRSRPRVNPDNPSYGYATDFQTTDTVRGNTKLYHSEPVAYQFTEDVAGAAKVNEHLARMPVAEREQWERNFRQANIRIVDDGEQQFLNGVVTLFHDSSDDTVFHEVSHSIDKKCVTITAQTSGKRKRLGEWKDIEPFEHELHGARMAAEMVYEAKGDAQTQFARDMSALFEWAGVTHKGGVTEMSVGDVETLLSERILQFKAKHGGDAASTLSDMIDAITLGKYPVLVAVHGGHGEEYWMRDASRRWGEGWAELSALHAQQNAGAIEEIRGILPETVDALDTVWRVVYERKPFEHRSTEKSERSILEKILRISPVDF